MPPPHANTNYLALLLQAAGEPFGMVFETNAPQALRRSLYSARARAREPMLSGLSFKVTAPGAFGMELGGVVVYKESAPRGRKALASPDGLDDLVDFDL